MKKLLLTVLALTLTIAMAIPALAADELLICDFANADQQISWNESLTTDNGVPAPSFSVEDGKLAITPRQAISGLALFILTWLMAATG